MNRFFYFTALMLVFNFSLFGLEPSQVAVLVNADEPASVSIGSFYCRMRTVPESNIIPLRLGKGAQVSISSEDYLELVAEPVRRALQTQRLSHIRCLVTTYPMPYKIEAPKLSTSDLELAAELEKKASEYKDMMFDIAKQLNPDFNLSVGRDLRNAVFAVQAEVGKVLRLIKATPDIEQREEKQEMFMDLIFPLYGAFIAMQMSQIEFNTVLEVEQDVLERAVASRELISQALANSWTYRKKIEQGYYSSYADVYGIFDLIETLNDDISRITGSKKDSAFDSELALVKRQRYDRHKWLPNSLRNDINCEKTLIVSRIDGASEQKSRQIIVNSIKAEAVSLDGLVCIDAGFPGAGGEEYARYDNSLKKTAEIFANSGRQVLLESTEKLISDTKGLKTAVYCGWYSPGRYTDVFDFAAGAVGYHISSFDASDIRNPSSRQWVVSMLSRGAAATIGAVNEPYLHAFPLPEEFFSLLIEGKSIGQAFAMTNPYNSWRVMLIADPLYTPFSKK